MSGRPESVMVVGGGPAGSTAAAILARQGLAVTLIEQSRQDREKVCGECLSNLGISALAEAGLHQVVQRLAPVALDRVRIVASGGDLQVRLPAPIWGLTRRALDNTLLEAARLEGARICRPMRAQKLVTAAGSDPAVMAHDLHSNEVRRLEADLIFIADGKSALLGDKPQSTGELGLKAHFEGVNADPQSILLFGLRGHYVGLAPVSDGQRILWNLAAAVPGARIVEFGPDHEALLAAMRRENPALGAALIGARRITPWLACPLPRFPVRKHWPPGVIPLGNAAAALEPIGGEGMGLAIASAVLAARCILEKRTGLADLRELEFRFRRLWRPRRLGWRALAIALSRPELARIGLRAARAAPGLVNGLIALTRAAPCSGTFTLDHRTSWQLPIPGGAVAARAGRGIVSP